MKDLKVEEKKFENILSENEVLLEILNKVPQLELPNWYLAAGCLAQTVWNSLHGFDITRGIKDYDLVYFDTKNLSYKKEDTFIKKGEKLFGKLNINVEIRNEARVHLWYKDHFGGEIEPYTSVESAIDTFPTTSTTIGIRKTGNSLIIYAPFDLSDLLSMIVRPNKTQITEEIYQKKIERWSKVWPKLTIIPW
jgi:hypothetical protein